MAVRLLTDSASSIPKEDIARYNIGIIPLVLVDGDRSLPEDEIDYDEFYAHLAQVDYLPTTSQPSPEILRVKITDILDAGDDVLAVILPETLSGTINALALIMDQIATENPAARERMRIIDAQAPCMQEGFAVLAGAKRALEGGDLAQCAAAVEAAKERTRFIFAPRSLDYLERGGRIGRASALLGGLLKLVPILTIEEAMATAYTKVRTYSKALITLRDKLASDIKNSGGLKNVCVHFIVDTEQAAAFCKNLIEPLVGLSVPLVQVSPVVGANVGPAIGLVYETVNPIAALRGESVLSRLGEVRLPDLSGLLGRRESDNKGDNAPAPATATATTTTTTATHTETPGPGGPR